MSDRTIDDRSTDRTDEVTTDREVDERTTGSEYDPNRGGHGRWMSAVVAVLGLWMIIESVVFGLTAAQFWNDIIVGLLLLAAGGYNYYLRTNERYGSVSAAVVAALVGLWLVVAPFVLGAEAGGAGATSGLVFWNDIIVGLAVLGLASYSAYEAREHRRVTGRPAS